MDRWCYSCCLLLTMTDLAWSGSPQVEPLFRRVEPAEESGFVRIARPPETSATFGSLKPDAQTKFLANHSLKTRDRERSDRKGSAPAEPRSTSNVFRNNGSAGTSPSRFQPSVNTTSLARQASMVGEECRRAGPSLFGLQVQVGADQEPPSTNDFHADSATPVGYFSDVASDPAQNRFEQFGGEPGIEEPPFVAVEGIDNEYEWRVLPVGVMYKSYLAGEKESRVRSVWLTDQHGHLVWETALGGRFSFLRHGTSDPERPEGWEFDFEGAALPRVDPKAPSSPLIAVDYRVGLLSVWRYGKNAYKAGYYHLSSHLGDEFLLLNPGFTRLNYVRDSGIVGWTHDLTPATQVYGEAAYAFNAEDGALPLEFQYGIQYSPRVPGLFGAPFGGINGHTRQDFHYETSVNVMAGWQWWSEQSNHTFRVGLQYYDGPSLQYSFVNVHEKLMGWGLWFDY